MVVAGEGPEDFSVSQHRAVALMSLQCEHGAVGQLLQLLGGGDDPSNCVVMLRVPVGERRVHR